MEMHPGDRPNPAGSTRTTKTVLWTVRGPGWSFHLEEDACFCPTEIATLAVELVWGEGGGESWKNTGGSERGTLAAKEGADPAVGIAMEVSHDEMNSRDEHIIIPSCLVLANAGFHGDAERLRREWESAPDEVKLASLIDLLGEDPRSGSAAEG